MPSRNSLAGGKQDATITKGRQFHTPTPPPVAFHFTEECIEDVVADVLEAIKRSAYRHSCPVSLYWFIDSSSVYLMPESHALTPTWEKHHGYALVGAYGFARLRGEKMVRPDTRLIADDLRAHAQQWQAAA